MNSDQENDPSVQKAFLMKLACERHENYISAARAILNLSRDEETGDDPLFENLTHILNLMAEEVGALNHMLEKQVEVFLNEEPYQKAGV